MSVTPITTPLAGEHVVAVAPTIAYPTVDAGWLRRLRLFTGRALDATALISEQDGRAGRITVLGQTRAAGVMTGLEVGFEPGDQEIIHVTAGAGLLASGEDVVLGRDLRIARSALAPIANDVRAAILTLVPVTVRVVGRFDPDDPCERDDSEDAFADEQRVDGVQVEWLPWDPAWSALDAAGAARNPLSWTIFELERALPFGEVPPWAVRGLPIALIGFDSGKIAYVDRHAVARLGGHAPARAPLVAGVFAAPSIALQEARILQLVDHLADLRTSAGLPSALAAALAFLPPAGVVPRDVMDLGQPPANRFFPPTWRLRAAAIPSEQLDGVLARAAGLAPLSTSGAEEVVVLVPVPQAVFEPHLLQQEKVDPVFQDEINGLVDERKVLLGRRLYLRNRRLALVSAIDPKDATPYTIPDPAALEDEGEKDVTELSQDEDAYATSDDNGKLRSTVLIDFRTNPASIINTQAVTPAQREKLYGEGLQAFIADLQALADAADDAIDFGFLASQTHIYRVRQHVLGTALASKLTTSPILATIAQGETAAAVKQNIVDFLAQLGKNPPPPHPAAPMGTPPPAPIAPPPASTATLTRTVVVPPSPARARAVFAAGGRPSPLVMRFGSEGLAADRGALLRRITADAGDVTDAPARRIPPSVDDGGSSLGDVRDSQPLIGRSDFRNVTSAQRIAEPQAAEARQYALWTRQELLLAMERLSTMGYPIDDITLFGVLTSRKADGEAERDNVTFKDRDTKIPATPPATGTVPLNFALEPAPPQTVSDSVWFNDVITILEAHVATLRALEGRTAQIRVVIDECKKKLAVIESSRTAVDQRLQQVEHELLDRRSAVATARALLADEKARVDRINTRRTAVIAQYANALAYVRPRYCDGTIDVPELVLEPALLESPVPACLAGHEDAPTEIGQMVGILREAPLSWLKYAPPILRWIDRVELVHGLVLRGRQRALALAESGFDVPFVRADLPGRLGPRISAVGRGQIDAVWQARQRLVDVDLRRFAGLSWTESRDAAQELVSLGDLIEGDHRRPPAVAASNAELANIEKIASCMWAQAGAVAPAIRLAWAEALDQYEAGRTLDRLTALPRWNEVPFTDRRQLELLAGWLADRVNPSVPAAVAWMRDLVRVCLLLASHAPVDQIIAGDVPQLTPAGPGHLVPVRIDPVRIRIGMQVSFHAQGEVVARGVVEDLIGGVARARVVEAKRPDLQLDAGTRARFAFAGSTAAPFHRELA